MAFPLFAGSPGARIPVEFWGCSPPRAACTVPPRKDARLHPKAPGFPWQLPEHPGCKCGAGRGAQQLGITPRDLSTFPSLPRAIRGSPLGVGFARSGFSVWTRRGARGCLCLQLGGAPRFRVPSVWFIQACEDARLARRKKKRFLRARLPSPSRLGSRKLPLSLGRSLPPASRWPSRPEAGMINKSKRVERAAISSQPACGEAPEPFAGSWVSGAKTREQPPGFPGRAEPSPAEWLSKADDDHYPNPRRQMMHFQPSKCSRN